MSDKGWRIATRRFDEPRKNHYVNKWWSTLCGYHTSFWDCAPYKDTVYEPDEGREPHKKDCKLCRKSLEARKKKT